MTRLELRAIEDYLRERVLELTEWDEVLTEMRDDVRHTAQSLEAARRNVQSLIGDNPIDPWHSRWMR